MEDPQTCILIDYATGENCEMPTALFQKYHNECWQYLEDGRTVIQQWMVSLTKEERAQILKR